MGRHGQLQLLLLVELSGDDPHHRRQGQAEQPSRPGRHGACLLGLGGDAADTSGGSLVDQGGVGAHLDIAGPVGHGAWQVPEGPVGQPAMFGEGRCLPDRAAEVGGDTLLERRQVGPARQRPLVADDPVPHPQVRGQPRPCPVLRGDRHAGQARELTGQRGQQRAVVGADVLQRPGGGVGRGDERATQRLRQGPDQRDDQLVPEAGDLPVEVARLDARQHLQGDVDGDAVGLRVLGIVGVVQRQVVAAHGPRVGVVRQVGEAVVPTGQQLVDGHVQQVRTVPGDATPPLVERCPVDDVGADMGVVVVGQDVLGGQQPRPSEACLELAHPGHGVGVGGKEPVAVVPVPVDERMLDEHGTGLRPIDPPQVDPPSLDDRQATEHDLLEGGRGGAVPAPLGVGVAAGDQVTGELLDPAWPDRGRHARPQPVGLHQLGGDDPTGGMVGERRPTTQDEPGAPRAEVLAAVPVPDPDVGQQPGQHGSVDAVVVVGILADGDAQVLDDPPQLAVDVLPLADAQPVQELLTTPLAELVARQLVLLVAEVVPQVQQRQEVRARFDEAGVVLLRGVGLVLRPFARILDRQPRGDDHDLVHAALLLGGQHHPGEPRVDRQPCQPGADLREGTSTGRGRVGHDRPELLQQRNAVSHLTPVGGLQERERVDVAEADGGHPEDDGGQVGAKDLRFGERGPCLEVLLGVQADGHTRSQSAAPPGPLVGRGLGDLLDRQPLDLGLPAVARHPCEARVDDVTDAGDGQGGLGDVGRDDDPPSLVPAEDAVLLGRRQPGVQGQDLGALQLGLAQRVGGVPDVPFAAGEHENVAGSLVDELLDRLDDPVHEVQLGDVAVAVGVLQGAVPDVHRVGAAGNLDDGRRDPIGGEVCGEAFGVDRRRRDDQLQVRSLGQQLGQVPEDEVDVEPALVRLVDDDRVVGAELAIPLQLVEQDPVGHDLDDRPLRHGVGEADRVADEVAHAAVQLLGDPFGHGPGGDPTGLGVADQAVGTPSRLDAQLGQLGALARSRLTGDHDDLMVTDGRHDLVGAVGDGQLGRPRRRRDGRRAVPCGPPSCPGGGAGHGVGTVRVPGPRDSRD